MKSALETVEFNARRTLMLSPIFVGAFFAVLAGRDLPLIIEVIYSDIVISYRGMIINAFVLLATMLFSALSLIGLALLIYTPRPLVILSAEGLLWKSFSSEPIPWTAVRTISSTKYLLAATSHLRDHIALDVDRKTFDELPKRGLIKFLGIHLRHDDFRILTSILSTGHDDVFAALTKFHSKYGSPGRVL